jgi:hypothetical protein
VLVIFRVFCSNAPWMKAHRGLRCHLAIPAALLALIAPRALAANMTPVAVTGFNWDVVGGAEVRRL